MNPHSPQPHMPEAEIFQYLENKRYRQVWWSVIMLLLASGTMVAIRILLGGVQSISPIGPTVFVSMLVLLLAIQRGFSRDKAAVIVLSILMLAYVTLGYLSGGLRSHFMVMAPFIPLLALLLHGLRVGIVCALFAAAVVVGFAVLHIMDYQFPIRPISRHADIIIQVVSIVIFITASTFVAGYYFKLSDTMATAIWLHANNDHMTGLANRRVADTALEREVKIARRNGTPLSVLMMDVDSFKRYNDVNGHVQGDACLKQVASVLAELIRRPADTIARYGGEEFIAILPDTHGAGAEFVAQKIRAAVEKLQILYDATESETLTISIGVACHQGEELDEATLVEAADSALYESKHSGRNRVTLAVQREEMATAARLA